jgi:hypothetical protein
MSKSAVLVRAVGRLVRLGAEARDALALDEERERVETCDQDVETEVEFAPLDQKGVHVKLTNGIPAQVFSLVNTLDKHDSVPAATRARFDHPCRRRLRA